MWFIRYFAGLFPFFTGFGQTDHHCLARVDHDLSAKATFQRAFFISSIALSTRAWFFCRIFLAYFLAYLMQNLPYSGLKPR
jgi:hypothetical protein